MIEENLTLICSYDEYKKLEGNAVSWEVMLDAFGAEYVYEAANLPIRDCDHQQMLGYIYINSAGSHFSFALSK